MGLSTKAASILTFLSAYEWEFVKEAFIALNKDTVHSSREFRDAALERLKSIGWVEFTGDGDVPKGYEWHQVGRKVLIRNVNDARNDPSRTSSSAASTQNKEADKAKRRGKSDTSVKPITDLKCPHCNGDLFKEGICPACEAGKRGLKVRLLCGECDWTVEL